MPFCLQRCHWKIFFWDIFMAVPLQSLFWVLKECSGRRLACESISGFSAGFNYLARCVFLGSFLNLSGIQLLYFSMGIILCLEGHFGDSWDRMFMAQGSYWWLSDLKKKKKKPKTKKQKTDGNERDSSLIPESRSKIPWRRKRQPTLVFLPGESHGWRSLVGYSPRGHKESDTYSNGMDVTEAEDIKRWQEYIEQLYKKKSSQPR